MYNSLNFDNYRSVKTNGTDLTSNGLGLSMGQPINGPTGPAAAPMDVTVNAPMNPLSGSDNSSVQQGSGFWSKDGGAGLVLGGVQVLGNLWSSLQAHKMAKEQMSFAREQWNTNLANQTQTYNTALEDRIRGRYATGTRSEEQLTNEIAKNRL
jgi:hypothetical protein